MVEQVRMRITPRRNRYGARLAGEIRHGCLPPFQQAGQGHHQPDADKVGCDHQPWMETMRCHHNAAGHGQNRAEGENFQRMLAHPDKGPAKAPRSQALLAGISTRTSQTLARISVSLVGWKLVLLKAPSRAGLTR